MANTNGSHTISVSHLNIRQSISFMLAKLVVLELVSAFFIIGFIFPLASIEWSVFTIQSLVTIPNIASVIFVILKLFLMIIIVLQWMNEYYEIQPTKLIHRRGVFFKYEEDYVFTHIMSLNLQQSPLGDLFNYGTIHMYDRYINKNVYMYLIHNPRRYFKILKELIPITDSEQEVFRAPIDDTDVD